MKPANVSGELGQEVVLRCQADSNPSPNYKWFRNGNLDTVIKPKYNGKARFVKISLKAGRQSQLHRIAVVINTNFMRFRHDYYNKVKWKLFKSDKIYVCHTRNKNRNILY